MKEFDWEKCKELRNARVYDYFAANFDKEVSREQFVAEMKLIQRVEHSKERDSRNHRRRSKHWNALTRGREYDKLKRDYSFFTGE